MIEIYGIYLLIGAMRVDTGAAILAGIRLTLLDILGTGVTSEAGWAVTAEAAAASQGGAGAPIAAW